MKLAAVLLSLFWLSACSFPQYDTSPPAPSAGGAGTAGTGSNADPSCSDGKRNGDETGIDCGMAACSKACPPGQPCTGNDDCDGVACLRGLCQDASCGDELKNGDESDKDCGGEQGCARCTVNQHCSSTSDCDGGLCASGSCRAPTCKDGLTNANETDMDCGGDSCTPCGVGQICGKTEDCDGVACVKGQCQPAACDDTVWNQDETDQDCGGSCSAQCDDGLRCKVASDCTSGVCPKQTLRCAVPACDDNVRNGDEPSADCGGSCSDKCALLDECRIDGDCATTSCASKHCVPTAASGEVLSPLKWVLTASNTLTTSNTKYAVDGSQSTNWISGADQTPGMWFLIDMASVQFAFSIEIDCNQQTDPDPTKTDVPQAIDIAFSETESFDGVTPVIKNRSIKAYEVITFAAPQVGRYLKITLTQGKNRWWRMDEIRVKQ